MTLNEAETLPDCLASVSWADEVIIVDSGSTDDTVSVATRMGATVHAHPWMGFAAQKNLAAQLAKNDMILNLDADERVTTELRRAIQDCQTVAARYEISRTSQFMGKFHRPVHRPTREYLVRLYDRTQARFGDVLVHEKVEASAGGSPVRLEGDLQHYGYRGMKDFVRRLNDYSSLLAAEQVQAGKTKARPVLRPTARFLWAYVRHRNILDGRRGLLLSLLWAFHDFLVEAKVIDAQMNARSRTH
ncbi:glycosyltransferase family 2 protein [Modestobacter sp. L9-4]|uniref:glycosyltransferase family 2 protein n=1 Tax=Modestobacter sp. L9-4 TaxID=2851567 RepID=UPI001C76287C|nr:glycosyltransferase family 2 protein [Modestobacter sp. L9-4]QXG74623.1 glycosyltransferase family 2 protein [Modestobacter sp. L9-4]